MIDAGHNYLSVVYSTTIYPYNADGRDLYELLECDYSFMKDTEKNGEVTSRVKGGVITLRLSSLSTNSLFGWFVNTRQKANGEILVTGNDRRCKPVLKFEDARCTGFRMQCGSTEKAPVLILRISSPKIRMGNTEFDKL